MAGSSDLVITAGLEVPKTVSNIKSELTNDVAPQLAGVLKITCSIDTSNIKNLQNQLNNVSKNIKIDANIGDIQPKINYDFVKQIEGKLNLEIRKSLNALSKESSNLIDEKKVSEVRLKMQQLLEEYQKFYQMGQDSNAFDFMQDKVIPYFQNFYRELDLTDEHLKKVQSDITNFARQAKVDFSSVKGEINGAFEQTGANNMMKRMFASGSTLQTTSKDATYTFDTFIGALNALNTGVRFDAFDKFNDVAGTFGTLYDIIVNGSLTKKINDTALEQQYWNSMLENTVKTINQLLGVTQRYNDEKALRSGDFVEIIGFEELDGAVNKATNSMNNLAEAEKVVVSNSALIKQAPQGFEDTKDVIENAKQAFSGLDGVLKATATDITQPNGEITRFTINVTDTTNAVRAFTYALQETKDGLVEFKLVGSRGNDAGIQKQFEENAKAADLYTSKLATLKKDANGFNISAILPNGATTTIEEFAKKIEGLRNGTASIKEVENSFVALDSELKSLIAIAKPAQGKSLDPLANAVISAREFDNTLKIIKTDIDSLSGANKSNLSTTYQELEKSYKELQNLPERTKEWLTKYSQVAASIRTVQSEIKLAKKLEREDSSSATQKTLAYLQQVKKAYKDIADNSKALNKTGLTAKQQTFYSGNIQDADKRLNDAIQALSTEKLITKEVQEQLDSRQNENTVLQTSLALERDRINIVQQEKSELKELSNESKVNKLADSLQKASELAQQLSKAYGKDAYLGQIGEIGKELNVLSKIDVKASGGAVEWAKQYEKVSTEIRQVIQDITKAKNAETQAANQAKKDYAQIESIITKYTKALQSFNQGTTARKNSSNTDVQGQISANQNLISQLSALQNSLRADNSAVNIARIKTDIDALVPSLQAAEQESAKLNAELRNNNAIEAREASIKRLQSQMDLYAKSNRDAVNSSKVMSSGSTFASEWQRLTTAVRSGTLDDNAIKQLAKDFQNFKTEAKTTGIATNKFFTDMGSQLKMIISRWVSLYAIIGKIRTMINYVVQLDDAMINLKRVTTATSEEYQKFLETAAETAQKTNTQLSDVVEQSARWAKAGFGLNELSDVSDASLIYSIVGDIDNETAVSDLVTALKGFRLEAKDTMSIVDKLDILNNKYATDAKSLGEGLSVSASAMAEAGNTLDQTLALLTGGSEITQNAKEMGNAIKIMSMRIRGMKGKLEELGEESEGIESISKIQTQILNLTSGKVNIFDDEGKFRGTYEILEDISKVIDKLSDPDRSSLTEILFGKMRGNQGLAILSAFQSGQINKALNDAQNSAGTAAEEMERYSTSVTAHITNFKSSVQELSNTMFSSDFLKFWVDFGSGAVTALTSADDGLGEFTKGILGVKTVLAGLVGVIASFKGANYGKTISNWFKRSEISRISKDDVAALRNYNALITQGVPTAQAQAQALNGASTAAQNLARNANGAAVSERLLADAENKVTFATKALTVAKNALLNVGITFAISAVIGAINKLVDVLIVTEEETKEIRNELVTSMNSIAESAKELGDSSNDLDDFIDKYLELSSTVEDTAQIKSELSSMQDTLIQKYGEEAEALDLINDKYSETIEKIKQLNKVEYEQWKTANADKIKEAEKLANLNVETEFNEFLNRGKIKGDYFGLEDKVKTLYEIKNISASIAGIASTIEGVTVSQLGYGNEKADILLSGTLEEAQAQLEEIINKSEYIADPEKLSKITEVYTAISNTIKDTNSTLDFIAEQDKRFDSLADTETQEKFNQTLEKTREAYTRLATVKEKSSSNTEILKAELQLENYKSELMNVSSGYDDLREIALKTINSMETGATTTKTSIQALTDDFNEGLDESFKSTLDNVEKLKKAMQSLAEGEYLRFDDFKEIAWTIDTEGIITKIEEIDGKYKLDLMEITKLKDAELLKEKSRIRQEIAETEKLRQVEIATVKAKLISVAKSSNPFKAKELLELKNQLKQLESEQNEYTKLIAKDNALIRQLNSYLGNTIDLTAVVKEQTEKITKDIDNQIKDLNSQIKVEEKSLKEQENQIEAEIESLENEKKIQEDIKQELEEQLEYLEEQQKELENIISNYETVADVAKEYAEIEIDSLKEQQEQIKNSYDEQINALKEIHDKKEEENDLVEKQIDLQTKLKELEDARNNKNVRTYSSTRGWHYAASKEDVVNAENAVKESEKTLNETVAENEYNQRIESLEKERDLAVESFETEIKAYEEYVKAWEEILKEETKVKNERLANEILGYDWREKIKNKDTALLESFSGEFKSYNRDLDNLVNNEIATLKNSIKAKENEISEIDKMIQAQNDYKSELQKASKSITDSLQDQIDSLNDYKDSLEESLEDSADSWDSYIKWLNQVADKQGDALQNMSTNVQNYVEDTSWFMSQLRNNIGTALDNMFEDDSTIAKILGHAWGIPGYSSGGTVTNTGIAMLHGKKNSAETVFNATQSRELYDMVKTGQFADVVANKAIQGINSSLNGRNINKSTIGDIVFNIEKVVSDSPVDFVNQLNGYMNGYMKDYWRTKLTEDYVRNN